MRNVSVAELADCLSISYCFPSHSTQVSGYQIDSNLIAPGDLFFALKGEKTDGHFYLPEVKNRGGVAAVVSKTYQGPSYDLLLLPVDDVAASLQELARQSISKSPSKIVGITGSVGKTTTKDFIATLLSGKYRVDKSFSSYNTKLTLPLSILNRKGDEEVLILEMGMSEPGDIERLVQIAPPDIAVLTKVALAHAAFFPGGIDQIAKGKGAIFSSQKLKTALFYHEFYRFNELVSSIQGEKLSFSLENRAADYFLSCSEGKYLLDERGVRAYRFELPFHQTPILHNFLAAMSVARVLKMEWEEIDRMIPQLELPKMRFEILEKQGITFINDAYNANPESMKAALSNLPEPKPNGKRIAILGTMKELGSFSKQAHEEVGLFAQRSIDHLLVLGEEAAPLCEAFLAARRPAELFVNQQNLAERLLQIMSPGDVVLLKGSRSMKMEKILDFLD